MTSSVSGWKTIFEIDPTRLRPLDFPLVGKVSLDKQALVTSLIMAATMPVYVTLDVENREKATRLLEHLSRQIFLEGGELGDLKTSLDAYRLPDYKAHALYVFSGRIYAVKIRLHVALVGNQLVAATKPEILREVIDASTAKETRPPAQAHMLLRLNRRALKRLYDDIRLYWAEKSRVACHRNIVSIHNLYKLYGTPIAQISRLSEAKYGVRYYCPDGGVYAFDPKHNQVVCSVHGNRERSRQEQRGEAKSSFAQFFESIDEVVASLRFRDDALIATVEIVRSKGGGK